MVFFDAAESVSAPGTPPSCAEPQDVICQHELAAPAIPSVRDVYDPDEDLLSEDELEAGGFANNNCRIFADAPHFSSPAPGAHAFADNPYVHKPPESYMPSLKGAFAPINQDIMSPGFFPSSAQSPLRSPASTHITNLDVTRPAGQLPSDLRTSPAEVELERSRDFVADDRRTASEDVQEASNRCLPHFGAVAGDEPRNDFAGALLEKRIEAEPEMCGRMNRSHFYDEDSTSPELSGCEETAGLRHQSSGLSSNAPEAGATIAVAAKVGTAVLPPHLALHPKADEKDEATPPLQETQYERAAQGEAAEQSTVLQDPNTLLHKAQLPLANLDSADATLGSSAEALAAWQASVFSASFPSFTALRLSTAKARFSAHAASSAVSPAPATVWPGCERPHADNAALDALSHQDGAVAEFPSFHSDACEEDSDAGNGPHTANSANPFSFASVTPSAAGVPPSTCSVDYAPAPLPMLARPPSLTSGLLNTCAAVPLPSQLGDTERDSEGRLAGPSSPRRAVHEELRPPNNLCNTPPSTPHALNVPLLGNRSPVPQDRPRRPTGSGGALTHGGAIHSTSSGPGSFLVPMNSEEMIEDEASQDEKDRLELQAKLAQVRQARRDEMERQLRLQEEQDEQELKLQLASMKQRRAEEKALKACLEESTPTPALTHGTGSHYDSGSLTEHTRVPFEGRIYQLSHAEAAEPENESFVPDRNQTAVFGSDAGGLGTTDLGSRLARTKYSEKSSAEQEGRYHATFVSSAAPNLSEERRSLEDAHGIPASAASHTGEQPEDQRQISFNPFVATGGAACTDASPTKQREIRLPSFGGVRSAGDLGVRSAHGSAEAASTEKQETQTGTDKASPEEPAGAKAESGMSSHPSLQVPLPSFPLVTNNGQRTSPSRRGDTKSSQGLQDLPAIPCPDTPESHLHASGLEGVTTFSASQAGANPSACSPMNQCHETVFSSVDLHACPLAAPEEITSPRGLPLSPARVIHYEEVVRIPTSPKSSVAAFSGSTCDARDSVTVTSNAFAALLPSNPPDQGIVFSAPGSPRGLARLQPAGLQQPLYYYNSATATHDPLQELTLQNEEMCGGIANLVSAAILPASCSVLASSASNPASPAVVARPPSPCISPAYTQRGTEHDRGVLHTEPDTSAAGSRYIPESPVSAAPASTSPLTYCAPLPSSQLLSSPQVQAAPAAEISSGEEPSVTAGAITAARPRSQLPPLPLAYLVGPLSPSQTLAAACEAPLAPQAASLVVARETRPSQLADATPAALPFAAAPNSCGAPIATQVTSPGRASQLYARSAVLTAVGEAERERRGSAQCGVTYGYQQEVVPHMPPHAQNGARGAQELVQISQPSAALGCQVNVQLGTPSTTLSAGAQYFHASGSHAPYYYMPTCPPPDGCFYGASLAPGGFGPLQTQDGATDTFSDASSSISSTHPAPLNAAVPSTRLTTEVPSLPQHLGPFVSLSCAEDSFKPFKRTVRCRSRNASRPVSPGGGRHAAGLTLHPGGGPLTRQQHLPGDNAGYLLHASPQDSLGSLQLLPYASASAALDPSQNSSPLFRRTELRQQGRGRSVTPGKRFLGGTTRLFGGSKAHQPPSAQLGAASDKPLGAHAGQSSVRPLSILPAAGGEPLLRGENGLQQPQPNAFFGPASQGSNAGYPALTPPIPILIKRVAPRDDTDDSQEDDDSRGLRRSRAPSLVGRMAAAATGTLLNVGGRVVGEVGNVAAEVGGTVVKQLASMIQKGFDNLMEGDSSSGPEPAYGEAALEENADMQRRTSFDGACGSNAELSRAQAFIRDTQEARSNGRCTERDRRALNRSAWFSVAPAVGAENAFAYPERSFSGEDTAEEQVKLSQTRMEEKTALYEQPPYSGPGGAFPGAPEASLGPRENSIRPPLSASFPESESTRAAPRDSAGKERPFYPLSRENERPQVSHPSYFSVREAQRRSPSNDSDHSSVRMYAEEGRLLPVSQPNSVASGLASPEDSHVLSHDEGSYRMCPLDPRENLSSHHAAATSGYPTFQETASSEHHYAAQRQYSQGQDSFYGSSSSAQEAGIAPERRAAFFTSQEQSSHCRGASHEAYPPAEAMMPVPQALYLKKYHAVGQTVPSEVSDERFFSCLRAGQQAPTSRLPPLPEHRAQHPDAAPGSLHMQSQRGKRCLPPLPPYAENRGRSLPLAECGGQTEAMKEKFEACDRIVGRWIERNKSVKGL
ncbi:hypothetical protein BESB_073070 [Besnoitia besnoiti]|uniref:Uncharacterized protein n=1 Tax=Besnoitia besnoiti TaxID=94643 RepID=A0A2A9M839_BESBE|nr:uncharacterized protein BESB_073070 [Besnoitia besnoiti]PFH34155.1 hypothetical protein BESB_073070 [Besnoitia besnoiti]